MPYRRRVRRATPTPPPGSDTALSFPPRGRGKSPPGGDLMSLIDKLTGRAKQAAGDLTGDRSLHRDGRKEETKGEKKEELGRAEERVEDKAQQVGELERDT